MMDLLFTGLLAREKRDPGRRTTGDVVFTRGLSNRAIQNGGENESGKQASNRIAIVFKHFSSS
jgi:hypothetical protein